MTLKVVSKVSEHGFPTIPQIVDIKPLKTLIPEQYRNSELYRVHSSNKNKPIEYIRLIK